MCGIFGVVSFDGVPPDEAAVIAARDTMVHRGPDDAGVYVSGQAALAHRRLSIIDISSAGRMPMSNETGEIWMTFNGEIYNFRELRNQLQGKGHVFRSLTDGETVVHAYEEWGESCFERLYGMFAIGIWDGRKKTLLLARDRLGKKPLYYTKNDRRFLFASTLHPLMTWEGFEKTVSQKALYEYVSRGYVPSPLSIFENTFKLPPGAYLALDGRTGETRQKLYWRIEDFALPEKEKEDKSEERYLDEFEELLFDSVERRLVSDVPLGIFLSGGNDSSLNTAIMKRLGKEIRSFHIAFSDPKLDESPRARRIAKILGVDLTVSAMNDPRILMEMVDQLPEYYDEPMADFSSLPTMFVSREARKHVTVVLSGDGGDEPFGGHDRYSIFRKISAAYPFIAAAPKTLRDRAAAAWRGLPPHRGQGMAVRMAQPDAFHFFGDMRNAMSPFTGEYLLGEKLSLTTAEEFGGYASDYPGIDPLDVVLMHETSRSMIDAIVHKVDRASMSCSLEVRSPLLDHRIIEFAIRLPVRYKIRRGVLKYFLKKLLSRHLPDDLVYGKKAGFTPPMSQWLRRELRGRMEDLLDRDRIRSAGYFLPEAVEHFKKAHLNRRREFTTILWALMSFEQWREHYGIGDK